MLNIAVQAKVWLELETLGWAVQNWFSKCFGPFCFKSGRRIVYFFVVFFAQCDFVVFAYEYLLYGNI